MTQESESSRRDAVRAMGGGALALLGIVGLGGKVVAQEGTPQAVTGLEGAYAVIRARQVKPEYSVSDVTESVMQDFVPMVREVPGFLSYFVVANEESRWWASIGIFTDKAGSDESTERASSFGARGTNEMIEGDPIVIEGPIDLLIQ